MILAITLSLLLQAAVQPPATASHPDGPANCAQGLNIQLPDPPGTAPSNVKIARFEEKSEDGNCSHGIDGAQLLRINQSIKQIAVTAFSNSQTTFGVMARYTLTPDRPASFKMQVAGAPGSEQEHLALFYRQASALTDFRSASGTVYVVLQLNISPALAQKGGEAH
ncbi:MAG TPA: hypothetical protein VK660_06335 [Xanthomonadaceae bacterium]|jgi:hypothetical protein|nr:hypothetical protein [Xanthomonadaceae bacterium]